MYRFVCAAVLAANLASGASLKHKHAHAAAHEKRVNFDDPNLYKDVNWASVFAAHPIGGAAPAAATPAAVASTPKKVASSAGKKVVSSVSGARKAFGGVSAAVANGNVDQYKGNVGVPYGSNMLLASSIDGYEYTITMKNSNSAPITVIVWNKSGPDGQPNSGQFSTPNLSFSIPAGGSQIVAFDQNSQGAFCESNGAKTQWGANDCTFGEFDFDNASNGGWSGYDVSSIQNTAGNNAALSISSPNGETSSNTGNNYVSDSQPGGIGGNLAPGAAHLTAVFG